MLLLLIFVYSCKTKKFRHQYTTYLIDQPSSYTDINDTVSGKSDNLCLLVFDRNKRDGLVSDIKISGKNFEQKLKTDYQGKLSLKIEVDTLDLEIYSYGFHPLRITNVPMSQILKRTIKVSLGRAKTGSKAHIYCKRKLKPEELDKLNEDVSLENKDNELLTSKTCYCTLDL